MTASMLKNRTVNLLQLLRSVMSSLSGRVFEKCDIGIGAALASLGIAMLGGGFGNSHTLDLTDPIFGFAFRHLMFVFGAVQLAIGMMLLFRVGRILALNQAAWICAAFLVYRAGLWSMGWHRSSGFVFEFLGLSLWATDLTASLLAASVLVVSCAIIWAEWRWAEARGSSKIFCRQCGLHIRFSVQDIGRKINCPQCDTVIELRRPENLKTSCFFCRGHIEFPAHAVGQKLQCPHCKMDITLKEPA